MPINLQSNVLISFIEPNLTDVSNYNAFYYITISPTSNKDCIF